MEAQPIDLNAIPLLALQLWPVAQSAVPNATVNYDLTGTAAITGLPPIEYERIIKQKEGRHGPKAYTMEELKKYAAAWKVPVGTGDNKSTIVALMQAAYKSRYGVVEEESRLTVEDD